MINTANDTFKFIIPADIEKSADGEWRIRGLASTEKKDQQEETIVQKGIDLTPIDKKQGYFNFDHQPGPENLVGVIDGYNKTDKGLYVEGRLFKNHTKAKAIHEIMTSLGNSDKGRVGLSVEGKILERDKTNPKIIKKCQIKNVAITLNPVNAETYADIVKSLTGSNIEFAANEENNAALKTSEAPTFTTQQVASLLKTLGLGGGAANLPPQERSGGDALEPETSKKKLKKLSKVMFKSNMDEILNKIQQLYPNNTRTDIWVAIKDRLEKKFPELSEKA